MEELSLIFEKAILLSNGYDSSSVSHEIEKIPQVWCRLEDDSNLKWYLISKHDKKSVVQYYGYLSAKYPVALLTEDCTDAIRKVLIKEKILLGDYYERYCCEVEILKNYVEDINLIDDGFLYDDKKVFDEELFSKIEEGLKYINPKDFAFEDIK